MTPWTDRHFIGEEMCNYLVTYTTNDNLTFPIHLTLVFVECGRKLENQQRTQVTQRT